MGKPKSDGKVPGDLPPRLASVVAAHNVPVLLHKQHVRPRRMHRDSVHAVADLGVLVGDALRVQAAVDRPPGLAASSEPGTLPPLRSRRTSGPAAPGPAGSYCRHKAPPSPRPAARAGRDSWPRSLGQLLPALTTVTGAEQSGVLDPGIHHVRVVQRRLEVPDPRELPRVRCPVVPLVRAGSALVGELVTRGHPGRAAVDPIAGSPALTSRWTATRTVGRGRPASLSLGRSPSPPSAGR